MNFKNEIPQYLAELIGTFFLVFFGCGAVILSELDNESVAAFIPIIFGGAVSIMIYATGHISGAHFNPAVTIAFWASKRLPATKIPGYIVAQVTGAILASVVHLQVWGTQHSFGVTEITTGVSTALLIEFILSFALMFVIISVATDSRAVGEMAGVAIGSTVALCAFVGGPLTGASMNPARSIGPAIVSMEFGSLWIYLTTPIVGTILGAKVYEWIRCESKVNKGGAGCC